MMLKYGMIGGGPGSFIGAIHRNAAAMDGLCQLTCGAFSSSPEKCRQTGEALFLPPYKQYASYAEMIKTEKELPAEERIDFVSIVTPNHVHFEPAKMSLENGFSVVLDKPMTLTLAEAKALAQIADNSGQLFCLTHTYAGYPMIKQARQMVEQGVIGQVRKIYVEYPQGWFTTLVTEEESKQAGWRTDPARSGAAGCMGDIGTHAFHLAEYITGLQVTELCAALNVVVPGHVLDDDGAVLLKFDNGATGVLMASQVAAGEENNLKIRIHGTLAGLEWQQEDCNSLKLRWHNKPMEVYRAGTGYLGSLARHNTRTPGGHPEGYIEAFANHYRNFALCLMAKKQGHNPQPEWLDFPGTADGLRGMAFIENVVASSASSQKWHRFTV